MVHLRRCNFTPDGSSRGPEACNSAGLRGHFFFPFTGSVRYHHYAGHPDALMEGQSISRKEGDAVTDTAAYEALTEKDLQPDMLLDNRGVLFFYGLTRQALYEAREAERLSYDQVTDRGSFLYLVSTLRAYRDSIDPRGRAASPMHRGKS